MAGVSKGPLNRFLVMRGDHYHYKRKVPAALAEVDDRAPHVRVSLRTSDLVLARQKRDALAAADDAYWASLLSDEDGKAARLRYEAAVRRAAAMGYGYKPVEEIAAGKLDQLIGRIESVMDERAPRSSIAAVLGRVPVPRTTISQALHIFTDTIAASELAGKSADQKRVWRKIFARAVANFTEVNGDLAMDDVEREHALKVFDFWQKRIAPREGGADRSPNSGNRDLSSLRRLYRDYYRYLGLRDRPNPFDDLSFVEHEQGKRPPFSTEWLVTRIMAPGALDALNEEARGCVLLSIETGLRPSEVANLDEHTILAGAPVPHVSVAPRSDPDDPRQVKTRAAIRQVPLVGVSLAVARAWPSGFPRYRNREYSLSATVNKHLRTHGLLPTPAHKFYSIRHAFEDRMKEGGLDMELRMILMGHRVDRAQYGLGGALKWRRDELEKIALPFDPRIVPVKPA